MNIIKVTGKLLILCGILAAQAFSQPDIQRNLFALKVSTLGVSVDAGRSVGKGFNIRVGGNFFQIPAEIDAGDFQFEGTLNLFSGSVMGDWFPMKGMFRLTAGSYINFNNATITLTPAEDQTIGGIHYTTSELGDVEGEMSFNVLSPYAGIGLGNAGTGKGLTFVMDLGVMYHGGPQFTLNSGPLLAPTAKQASLLEKNLEWAAWYPILALGVAYRM